MAAQHRIVRVGRIAHLQLVADAQVGHLEDRGEDAGDGQRFQPRLAPQDLEALAVAQHVDCGAAAVDHHAVHRHPAERRLPGDTDIAHRQQSLGRVDPRDLPVESMRAALVEAYLAVNQADGQCAIRRLAGRHRDGRDPGGLHADMQHIVRPRRADAEHRDHHRQYQPDHLLAPEQRCFRAA